MKLVCAGAYEKVIGSHLSGDNIVEILLDLTVSVKMGVTKLDIDNTIAIRPISSEKQVIMKQGGPRAIQCKCGLMETHG